MEPTVASCGFYPKLNEINTSLPAATCSLPHCAGSPIDMPSPIYPEECEECVTECDIQNCDLSTESGQCTDRCVVVPCDDPCFDVCSTTCTSLSNSISQGGQRKDFEELLSHCSDVLCLGATCASIAGQPVLHQNQDNMRRLDWNNASLSRELDALICACDTQSFPHSFDSNSCDPKLLSVNNPYINSNPHVTVPPSNPVPISGPGSPASALFSSFPSSSGSSRSSPDLSTVHTSISQHSEQTAIPEYDLTNMEPHEQPSSRTLCCLWADCGASFDSFEDLISHVNIAHLHLPIVQGSLDSLHRSPSHHLSSSSRQRNGTRPDLNSISCMWGKCNLYPTLSDIPGPSTGNATDATLGLLASHLLQDHLGMPVAHLSAISNPLSRDSGFDGKLSFPDPSAPSFESAPHLRAATSKSDSFPTRPQPVIPTPGSKGTSSDSIPEHLCKWQSCPDARSAFASSADLTAHITNVHVGSGKARYHCMWEGCNRHGEGGFSSKQKILRHVQSHTGHRPFRCKTCDQYFSEAATLQQHMRRHTKEKPYVCDFPGCNKAFAITGALTIHRRCHSGVKPFKCTYCDRSFSESSNLSKHVRTHTGDRPYACPHPGCEKRFARPDQVARHMNVHNKKKAGDHEETVDPRRWDECRARTFE